MRAKSRIDPDWEETDPNYRIKRDHGAVLIDRQAKVIAVGYRVDVQQIVDAGEIPLVHPNRRVPKLVIWDDGLVNDMAPSQFRDRDDERTIFEPEDVEGFERFIASVPRPTFLERIRVSTVEEAVYVLLAWTILVAFLFAATNIGEQIWDWLKGF